MSETCLEIRVRGARLSGYLISSFSSWSKEETFLVAHLHTHPMPCRQKKRRNLNPANMVSSGIGNNNRRRCCSAVFPRSKDLLIFLVQQVDCRIPKRKTIWSRQWKGDYWSCWLPKSRVPVPFSLYLSPQPARNFSIPDMSPHHSSTAWTSFFPSILLWSPTFFFRWVFQLHVETGITNTTSFIPWNTSSKIKFSPHSASSASTVPW